MSIEMEVLSGFLVFISFLPFGLKSSSQSVELIVYFIYYVD